MLWPISREGGRTSTRLASAAFKSVLLITYVPKTPYVETHPKIISVHGTDHLEPIPTITEQKKLARRPADALFCDDRCSRQANWLSEAVPRDVNGWFVLAMTFGSGLNIVQVFRLKRICKDLLHGGVRHGSNKRLSSGVDQGRHAIAFLHQSPLRNPSFRHLHRLAG
jgi:hypothetical protein